MEFRVGLGQDCHRLKMGRRLILGGVPIHHDHGLLGHSDADVLLHAITDALLGAAGLGDIGEHFPNSDREYYNAASSELLQKVWELVKNEGWSINNLDCTISAERPKLSSHKPAIRKRVAELLDLPEERVNIKAKTGEQVGPVGRNEAMMAEAIVLVQREARS